MLLLLLYSKLITDLGMNDGQAAPILNDHSFKHEGTRGISFTRQ
jgi:hypothetical protein